MHHYFSPATDWIRLGGRFFTHTHTHTHTLTQSLGGVNGVCNHPRPGPPRAISLNEGLRWWNRARPFTISTANFCSARLEHGAVSAPWSRLLPAGFWTFSWFFSLFFLQWKAAWFVSRECLICITVQAGVGFHSDWMECIECGNMDGIFFIFFLWAGLMSACKCVMSAMINRRDGLMCSLK